MKISLEDKNPTQTSRKSSNEKKVDFFSENWIQ